MLFAILIFSEYISKEDSFKLEVLQCYHVGSKTWGDALRDYDKYKVELHKESIIVLVSAQEINFKDLGNSLSSMELCINNE